MYIHHLKPLSHSFLNFYIAFYSNECSYKSDVLMCTQPVRSAVMFPCGLGCFVCAVNSALDQQLYSKQDESTDLRQDCVFLFSLSVSENNFEQHLLWCYIM